jgi:hypothetical protein
MNHHICMVDCELEIDSVTHEVRHIMYPADPTPHAGRYQHTLNLNMTRREYRESGQDETRECRLWSWSRNKTINNGQYYRKVVMSPRRMYRMAMIP